MMDRKKAMEKLKEHFGGPMEMLGHMILTLSMSGQPCDVTFRDKKAALDVKIDPQIALALMYGAGPGKLQEMLASIRLSNGDVISINEIWVVLPMSANGFSKEELAEVDLAKGEEVYGPNGETVREMVRNVYHCESKEEEEKYLRRYLAS